MRSAASPLAELAADALPAAVGGLSGGGACITSSNKLDERCSKGNKTCSKGKLSYPSNIGKISKPLTHNTLQKQDLFKGRKNLPFQHKTQPFEHITLTSKPEPPANRQHHCQQRHIKKARSTSHRAMITIFITH